MKYIVFSFDDGLHNFIENALPILNKYGFKATINVIAGFTKEVINFENNIPLVEKEVIDLYNCGHEIAMHSYSHLHKETVDDFKKCYAYLSSILNCKVFGACMPFNQLPSKELMEYFNSISTPYVAIGEFSKLKPDHKYFLYRIKRKFFRNKKYGYLLSTYLITNPKEDDCETKIISRFNILKETNIEDLRVLIKGMKNETCLTLMFHAITKNENEYCSYPDGSFSAAKFEKFCRFLYKNKKCKVITQMDFSKKCK